MSASQLIATGVPDLRRMERALSEDFVFRVISADGDRTKVLIVNQSKPRSDDLDHVNIVEFDGEAPVNCTCKDYKYRANKRPCKHVAWLSLNVIGAIENGT